MSTKTDQPSNTPPIQLSANKRVHVIHDGSLTDEAREIDTRRSIWMVALMDCVQMLRTAVRANAWGAQTGSTWDGTNPTFPTPVECIVIGKNLSAMAVITFLTMFKSGYEDKGNVAGNGSPAVAKFRDECVRQAFPNGSDRCEFDDLYKRLERTRDGLLAHADGTAQEVEHSEKLTSFGPQGGGITAEDLALLLICAEKLQKVVQAKRVMQSAGG